VSEPTKIRCATGDVLTMRDWTFGPLADAACRRCNRLAYLMHVDYLLKKTHQRLCDPCWRTVNGGPGRRKQRRGQGARKRRMREARAKRSLS
jgi:hypothetical protein